jgi:hypothetical protein
MSGMPQEYRAGRKKRRELTRTRRARCPYGTSLAHFFLYIVFLIVLACSQDGERPPAGYQFYRIKTGSRVTPIKSLGIARSIRMCTEK